jgi:hypothetical protein
MRSDYIGFPSPSRGISPRFQTRLRPTRVRSVRSRRPLATLSARTFGTVEDVVRAAFGGGVAEIELEQILAGVTSSAVWLANQPEPRR